jgi:hypothetical protein
MVFFGLFMIIGVEENIWTSEGESGERSENTA